MRRKKNFNIYSCIKECFIKNIGNINKCIQEKIKRCFLKKVLIEVEEINEFQKEENVNQLIEEITYNKKEKELD